ncbi:MAG: alpha/beta fold hydrolase [Deltaproteobacteria bacterium]|nr:alpha/beta fold hydrolase [Deltaproteobacteria bacterium]
MLHGFSGAPELWAEVRAALDPAIPISAPTLPGHGGRPFPAADGVAAIWRSCARAVAPETPAIWVGYSLGARIALAALDACPERVLGLVLIGGHPGLRTDAERDARAAWEAPHAACLGGGDLGAFVAAWEREPIFASQAALPARVRDAQRRVRAAHDPAGLAAAFTGLALSAMPDRRALLAAAGVPVTLVHGALDARYAALHAELAALAPVAVRAVPGAGHNVPLEAPAALAALLTALATGPWPPDREETLPSPRSQAS